MQGMPPQFRAGVPEAITELLVGGIGPSYFAFMIVAFKRVILLCQLAVSV